MARLGKDVQLADYGRATPDEDWDVGWKRHEDSFKALMDKSDALKPNEYVGALLRFQRGDGYAWYRVESLRPPVLAWVPYSDAWQVEPELIRGMRAEDIKLHVDRERRLQAMFKSKRSA